MIDFHAHILPGADHGSDGLETSKAQLGCLFKEGITRVVATPHFYPQRHSVDTFLERRDRAKKEILTLKEEKKVLDAQSKALETRIKSLYAPIVEQMGTACKASCEHGSECFRVTYNPQYREGINKDRLSALRAQYPEIYDEFVDQTELRIFKVVKTAIA